MTAPPSLLPVAGAVTGVRVHLRTPAVAAPEEQRRSVLLLHGMANGPHAWNGVVGGWGPGVAVWTAELPWGLAASAEDYQDLDPAACVAAAIDQVPGGCDLVVGHSFAALALLDLLSRWGTGTPAAMPAGVVFVAPFFRRHLSDFAWQMIAGLPSRFEATLYEGIRLYSGRPQREELHRDMARRVCEWIGPYGWLRFISMYLGTPQLRPDLITVPGLVVAGGRDTTAPPAEAAALAAALPAGALHVLPDCGHFPMVQRPAVFLERATALLSSLPPRGDLRRPALMGER